MDNHTFPPNCTLIFWQSLCDNIEIKAELGYVSPLCEGDPRSQFSAKASIMRCPKCGFISFDLLEKCVKCGKKISTAAEDLGGMVASVPPPLFFKVDVEESAEETQKEGLGGETEETFDLGEGGDEEVMDFSLDEEAEETTIDLGDVEESEAELDLGEEETAEEVPDIELESEELTAEEPQAEEEAGMDIADLAPSEEAEQFTVEEETESTGEEEPETARQSEGRGLADLKVEGLDLDPTAAEADSDKIKPSVKTGTALDDFDIELGDLMPDDEKD